MRLTREAYIPREFTEMITRPELGAVVYLKNYGHLPGAIGFQGKRARPEFMCTFKAGEEAREEFIARFFSSLEAQEARKRERKTSQKAQTEAFLVSLVPGVILYDTWGYDQTQVEFFKVVARKGARVLLQELAHVTVPGSEGMMCDRVVPGGPLNKAPIWKVVRSTHIKIDSCISLRAFPLEYMEKGVHHSWYA